MIFGLQCDEATCLRILDRADRAGIAFLYTADYAMQRSLAGELRQRLDELTGESRRADAER